MSAPQIAPFTAADYREMPDDGRRYQLVEGEFFMAPAPNTFHQFVQKNLLRILDTHLSEHSPFAWPPRSKLRGIRAKRPLRGPGSWNRRNERSKLRGMDPSAIQHPVGTVLGAPCDVYLDDLNVFQPDVLFVSRDHGARIQDDGIHGAPDLAIEILSPSSAALDRRKRGLLAKAGTVEFWQIDPALRQIQRFVFAESAAKPVALIDEPETFTSPLFPGLALATAETFRR